MRSLIRSAALVAILALPSFGQAVSWQIDPQHSSAQFSVRHLMVSNVRGEFHGVRGVVQLDEKDNTKSSVEVTIDATTIDTREPDRDKHLRSADFLDTTNHPTVSFKSKGATKAGEGRLQVVGDLTIRGVTREVSLNVEGPTAAVKDPWGNLRRGASATTKINRKDFGVAWSALLEGGGAVVGDEVTITIDVEFIRKAS